MVHVATFDVDDLPIARNSFPKSISMGLDWWKVVERDGVKVNEDVKPQQAVPDGATDDAAEGAAETPEGNGDPPSRRTGARTLRCRSSKVRKLPRGPRV